MRPCATHRAAATCKPASRAGWARPRALIRTVAGLTGGAWCSVGARPRLVVACQRFALIPFQPGSRRPLRCPLPPATKWWPTFRYNITGPLVERLVGRLEKPIARSLPAAGAAGAQEVGQGASGPGPRQQRLSGPELGSAAGPIAGTGPGPVPPPLLSNRHRRALGVIGSSRCPPTRPIRPPAAVDRLLRRCFPSAPQDACATAWPPAAARGAAGPWREARH